MIPIISLARIGVDMGISGSGVRQIASALGSSNPTTIATTVFTLRRVCLLLGLSGAAVLFLIREIREQVAFGDPDHAFDIGLLSVILLFVALTGGQGALLQGMRRIGDLAKMNILGAAFAAILSIPIVYIWGLQGIPAYMVLTAAPRRSFPGGMHDASRSSLWRSPCVGWPRKRKPIEAGSGLRLERPDIHRSALFVARVCDARNRSRWSRTVSGGERNFHDLCRLHSSSHGNRFLPPPSGGGGRQSPLQQASK